MNETVSRRTYEQEAEQAAETMTEFIDSVLAGDVPSVLVADVFNAGVKAGSDLAELIEGWRVSNLEALALAIESIEILHRHEHEFDLDAFWQFCRVCTQLEDSLRSRLISLGA